MEEYDKGPMILIETKEPTYYFHKLNTSKYWNIKTDKINLKKIHYLFTVAELVCSETKHTHIFFDSEHTFLQSGDTINIK